MKQFNSIEQLLKFIVDTAKEDYYDGFYDIEPDYDDEGRPFATMNDFFIEYNGHKCQFFGGEVGFSCMDISFQYKNLFFRAIHCTDTYTYEDMTRIAFAPSKEILSDQCWCIEIPVEIHPFIYEIEKICS